MLRRGRGSGARGRRVHEGCAINGRGSGGAGSIIRPGVLQRHGDHTADRGPAEVFLHTHGIGMHARRVDQLAEGPADARDVVHEIVDFETEVFASLQDIRLRSKVFCLSGITLFYSGLVDHAAFTIGPGEPEQPSPFMVRDTGIETLKGGHNPLGERIGGEAAEAYIVR